MWVETPGSAGTERRGCATATGAGPRRRSCRRRPVPSSSQARDRWRGATAGSCALAAGAAPRGKELPAPTDGRPEADALPGLPRPPREHRPQVPAPQPCLTLSPLPLPRRSSVIPAPWGQRACEAVRCCCPLSPRCSPEQRSGAQGLPPHPALLISALPEVSSSSCSPASPPQAPDASTQPSSWLPLPLFPYNNWSTLQDPACGGPFPTTPLT